MEISLINKNVWKYSLLDSNNLFIFYCCVLALRFALLTNNTNESRIKQTLPPGVVEYKVPPGVEE